MKVAITGGAGFLGRAFIDRARDVPEIDDVTVVSRDEHKHHRLKAHYPDVRTVLCDVRDETRLTAIFAGHDAVIHAAAMKYVPEAERDVSEAIATNITGSMNVARACANAGIKRAVAISTDKAVDPVNTYGATKMVMERAWQEAARVYPTDYRLVRYGNVVSSTGSVIPLFLDQILETGRVRITSARMTRFWLGIGSAVELIMRALLDKDRNRGCVYVARCPASTITAVAKACAMHLCAPEPELDIIGTRPGEKIDEVLMSNVEAQFAENLGTGDGQFGPLAIIPPALSQHGDPVDSLARAYSSGMPSAELSPAEIVELIEESRRYEW